MFIGYARISTQEQCLNLQIDALKKAGCEDRNIYQDTVSGSKSSREGLDQMLQYLPRANAFKYSMMTTGYKLRF